MGDYNANTNWDNERKYLNNLIAGGGGNAEWAKQQMSVLDAAQKQYATPTVKSSPSVSTPSVASTVRSTPSVSSPGVNTTSRGLLGTVANLAKNLTTTVANRANQNTLRSSPSISAPVKTYTTPTVSSPSVTPSYSAALAQMTNAQLLAEAQKNSQAWFDADAAQKELLHQRNEYINKMLDARNGTTTTYDPRTGAYTTAQRDTSWYNPAVYDVSSPANQGKNAFNGLYYDEENGQLLNASNGLPLSGSVQWRDWANDKTDWAAAALGAQSMAEIQTLLDGRARKAQAQGIDISGADPDIQSNDQIFQQWWNSRGKYIPDKFRSWDGTDGVGYYGTDETGDHGYYADPERTIKLANGNWGVNPNKGESRLTTSRGDAGMSYPSMGYASALASYGDGYGYGDNDLIMQLMSLYNGQNSGYAQALAAQQAAQDAAVQQAINRLNAQKTATGQSYDDYARQAYIDKMNARKNIDQRMAAQGVNGGAAESTLLALDTAYSEALRQQEQERINTLAGLDQAISNTRLTGDINNAQAAAEFAQKQTDNYADVLQSLINRYDTLAARDQAYAREDAQRAEQYARDDEAAAKQYAYQMAMQLLGSGNMPDAATLSAAGINANDAAALVAQYNSQLAAQSKPKLTAAQVNAAIKAGTLTPEVLSAYEYWYGAPYSASASAYSVQNSGSRDGTGNGGYSGSTGGLTDSDIVAAAQAYVQRNPAIDMNGLNSYLNSTGLSSSQKELFKAYVRKYGGSGVASRTASETWGVS